ncbi:hypothetical protein FB451DRAFT_1563367 [Mycena latifolia]|nr:hypothetical protein FB451DRAFT_1563367 [Mycena latifolia]
MARPKRAATTSQGAKAAADIAATEAREDAKEKKKLALANDVVVPQKTCRRSQCFPSLRILKRQLLFCRRMDWTVPLTWSLIGGIEDDEEIRDALFPGVGANKLANGKPKTHYFYKLAQNCFAEHPDYMEAFAMNPEYTPAQRTNQRKLWTEKIKNKVKTLVAKARENITEMGQTGAGITSEDQVQPGTAFATKWDLMLEDSPWFIRMRTLIAARPNLQPVGLGNNDTGFDVSLLIPHHDDDDTSSAPDTQDFADELSEPDPVDPPVVDVSSDSDDDLLAGPTLAGSIKRKHGDDHKPSRNDPKPPAKRTKPMPATSAPAAPSTVPSAKKPTNAKDRFSATVLAEEETAQQALTLKREKNKYRGEVALAKIQMAAAKAEARKQERATKMDLVRLKMQQAHELQMAQLQAQAGPSVPLGRSSPSMFSGSSSSLPRSPFPAAPFFLEESQGFPTLPSADDSGASSSYKDFGAFSGSY